MQLTGSEWGNYSFWCTFEDLEMCIDSQAYTHPTCTLHKMSHFLQEIHKQLFSAHDTYMWHTQTNAGLDLWIPLCFLYQYCILQLWFLPQSISLLFKLLVQELAKLALSFFFFDDDGLFDVVSHLKSDTSPKAYHCIIKNSTLVGLRGGCQVQSLTRNSLDSFQVFAAKYK